MDKTVIVSKEWTEVTSELQERASIIDDGIDLLIPLGDKLLRFVERIQPKVSKWDHYDYVFIFLRAVGLSNTDAAERIRVILLYSDSPDRNVLEAVVEALKDVGGKKARREISRFTSNSDPFIADLAKEFLSEWSVDQLK